MGWVRVVEGPRASRQTGGETGRRRRPHHRRCRRRRRRTLWVQQRIQLIGVQMVVAVWFMAMMRMMRMVIKMGRVIGREEVVVVILGRVGSLVTIHVLVVFGVGVVFVFDVV